MIDLAHAFREAETECKFDILDFHCEYCDQGFNSFSFNLSVFLYGVFFLTGNDVCYAGIICPKCLKTILIKGKTLERLKQQMLYIAGTNNPNYSPDYRYHSSVLFSQSQFDQLQRFDIIRSNSFPAKDIDRRSQESETDYLVSYNFTDKPPIGTLASIWWYKPDDIESLVEIENEHQIRVFPRYVHNMSWYEKYDDYCWSFKLCQEYLVDSKKPDKDILNSLREYAYKEGQNLDKLLEINGVMGTELMLESIEQQVHEKLENNMYAASDLLNLLLFFDPAPWDIPGTLSDFYKDSWKAPRPFVGASVPDNLEKLGKLKFKSKMKDTEVKALSDEIRPYSTKTRVQEWAMENHQRFIDDFIAIARRSDFSYGYVWELKCKYLRQLHDNLDKSAVDEARYAFFSEGPTWTIIFNRKVLRGLRGGGFQYIEYLIKNPGKRFHVTQLHEIIVGSAVDDFSDDDKTTDETSEENTFDCNDDERSDETAGDNESNIEYIARELGISFKGVSRHKKIDDKSYAHYKTIIFNLNKEIEEARKKGDISTENQKQDDRDKIRSFFLKDIGLGGRPREFRDENTKIKDKIARAINRAISKIEKDDPEMAEHFKKSLTPIYSFQQCYHPDMEINWQFKD